MIGYVVSNSKKPDRISWLEQEWRVKDIVQTPNPLNGFEASSHQQIKEDFESIKQNGYIRFYTQGHYVASIFTYSTGMWELKDDVIILKESENTKYIKVEKINSYQLTLSWVDNNVETRLFCSL